MVDINYLSSGNYWKSMGMKIERQADGVIVKMETREEVTQVYGNIHGGAVAGLIDSAIAVAVNSEIPKEYGANTIEMKVNYLRPANGNLIGKGTLIKKGKNIIVGQAEVYNEDNKMVAHGTATFMVLPPSE